MSKRSSDIYINTENLAFNVLELSRLAEQQKIRAVVKADAYGHQLQLIIPTLKACGIDAFCVTSVEEGILLRQLCPDNESILILSSPFEENIHEAIAHQLTLTIGSIEQLNFLLKTPLAATLNVQLEIDTGMNRTGIKLSDLAYALEALVQGQQINLLGVFSHFADADTVQSEITQQQLEKLAGVLLQLKQASPNLVLHFSNSAGILSEITPDYTHEIRPGVSLYGVSPAGNTLLKPVKYWFTRPIQIKHLAIGEGVSYNHTWVAERPTVVAVLPVGYADGYPRNLSNKGYVGINYQKANIIGNICMDFMMVDVTDINGVDRRSKVELFGDNISVSELAVLSDTIAYELLCNSGKRSTYQLNR